MNGVKATVVHFQVPVEDLMPTDDAQDLSDDSAADSEAADSREDSDSSGGEPSDTLDGGSSGGEPSDVPGEDLDEEVGEAMDALDDLEMLSTMSDADFGEMFRSQLKKCIGTTVF